MRPHARVLVIVEPALGLEAVVVTTSSSKAAALDKVPGATIVRIETDADGHAAYEAHLIKQDGTPTTVCVDKQFDVVGVWTR